MFNEYRASPLHSVGFLFLGVIFGSVGTLLERAGVWFYVAGGICFLISIAVGFWVFWEHDIRRWDAIGFAAEKISRMDDHRFQVLGLAFPSVRGKWSNNLKPVIKFDDCEYATMEHFAIFLNGSDSKQVFPVRYWSGEKEFKGKTVALSGNAYYEILQNLVDNGFVRKESAAGSHSWLWVTPETYTNLKKYWGDWLYEKKYEIKQG